MKGEGGPQGNMGALDCISRAPSLMSHNYCFCMHLSEYITCMHAYILTCMCVHIICAYMLMSREGVALLGSRST